MNKINHNKLYIQQISNRRYCINNIKISISVICSIINQYYTENKNNELVLKNFYQKKIKDQLSSLNFIEPNELDKINNEYFFGQKTVRTNLSNFIVFLYTLNIHYNEVPKIFKLILKDHESQQTQYSINKIKESLEKKSQNNTHNDILIVDYVSKI